jgi:membrane protein
MVTENASAADQVSGEDPDTDDPDPDDPDTAQKPSDVLTLIPGDSLDQPPKPKPDLVETLEDKSPWAKAVWNALLRFKTAQSTLIAAGTAYYAFIAMFSLLALVYGIAALFNADEIAKWMTDALEDTLPGLVGDDGINPDTLARVGRASSLIGLVLLALAGSAVMNALSGALHTIFGAPSDGRNFVLQKARLLGWLAVLGPLMLISYALTTTMNAFGEDILSDLNIESGVTKALLTIAVAVVGFALDALLLFLVLGHLGGIRPNRRSILPGALLGALVFAVFKELMALILEFSIDKPQYGSFAVPIGILFVFWLQFTAVYACASLTAGIAETPELHTGTSNGSGGRAPE